MNKKTNLFDFDAINEGFKEMERQDELQYDKHQYFENKAAEKTGILFDFERLSDAFNVMERQSSMQDYEGKFVDIVGSFIKLGYDKRLKNHIHALVKVLSINKKDVYGDVHIWIKGATLLNKDFYKNAKEGDLIELSGKIYPYTSSGDKKYSLHL